MMYLLYCLVDDTCDRFGNVLEEFGRFRLQDEVTGMCNPPARVIPLTGTLHF